MPARDARRRLPPSLSANAVTPTRGGLPDVRFALRHWLCGLREARSPPGLKESRGPQRPRRGVARPQAGGGGGRNDAVLPPARRWGAAASLQDRRSSAAASPEHGCASRQASCPRGARRRPRLSPPSVGNVFQPRIGSSRRIFLMPLAWISAIQRCFTFWATVTSAAAPSLAVFWCSRFARRCAVGGRRDAARTPQSQIGEI